MYSIAFPNFLSSTSVKLVEDRDATMSNLKLLLGSEKRTLFGDPGFGSLLKRFIFEQNNQILRDLVIDEIYTDILQFMPQIFVERKNIEVNSDGVDVFTKIKCVNKLDKQIDLYEINLTSDAEDMVGE